MKKRIALLAGILTVGMLSVLPASAAETSYTDVPADSWYGEAVNYAVENGLFTGTSDTTFDPNGTMTRGMFVTALGRMAGIPAETPADSGFSDVASGAYYAPYVAWAAENNIVNGMGNGTFEPDTVLDREQMCTIFVRYLQEYLHYDTSAYEGTVTTFADADQISSWAAESVSIAQAMGLVQGIESDGVIYFSPKESVTRAAGVTIFVRVDQTIDGGTTPENPEEPDTPDPEDPDGGNTDNPGTTTPGGGGGGGTPTTPSDPDTPDDGTGDTEPPTEEEIAEEAQVAGYLENMCRAYVRYQDTVENSAYVVRDSMELLMSCLNDALDDRENGTFLSSEYVRTTYADEIAEFKRLYTGMSESQITQLQNIVALLESSDHIYWVLDYFGVSTANL